MTEVTEEYDLSLEPEVLTDKDKTKTLPCRRCRRPCVVNTFASPSKTECLTCRGQGQVVTQELEFNDELEPQTLTGAADTKELPCRKCQRRCTVNRSASPAKVECTECRAGPRQVFTFNDELETEILTDRTDTKEVPCTECGRRCVVTVFKTASKTQCNTCRGVVKHEKREKTKEKKAASIGDIASLENLRDGVMNAAFKTVPLCPFDPEHDVELKSISHTPYYGPRHFRGYVKGVPTYDQETGESVIYQCNSCNCTISFSTQHPMLRAQNEKVHVGEGHGSTLAIMLGVRETEYEEDVA